MQQGLCYLGCFQQKQVELQSQHLVTDGPTPVSPLSLPGHITHPAVSLTSAC
jgi:hypothetical protein